MRYPGGKFKLWSPRYTNKPDIGPPASLKAVAIMCIVVVGWSMWHAVVLELTYPSGIGEFESLVFAILSFLFPVVVSWSIISNLAASRFLIVAYYIGFVGLRVSQTLISSPSAEHSITLIMAALFGLAALSFWLFRSRRMRFYYSIISGRPLTPDLADDAENLLPNPVVTGKARKIIDRFVDSLETFALIAVIVVVFVAYWLTGG